MRKREMLFLPGALVICFFLLGSRGRGVGFSGGIQALLMVWVGIPVLVCGVIRFVMFFRLGREQDLLRLRSVIVLILSIGAISATYPIGKILLNRDIEEAKAFCEELISRDVFALERGGRYPDSLKGLVIEEELPRLLRGREFYSSAGDTFEFHFEYGFGYGWYWNSRAGRWHFTS